MRLHTTLLAATASGESPCRSTAESLPALAVSAEESVLFLMLPSILLLSPFMDFILGVWVALCDRITAAERSYDVVKKGWGVAQEADVAIRLLFESGSAKTPSEEDVPAPRDGC